MSIGEVGSKRNGLGLPVVSDLVAIISRDLLNYMSVVGGVLLTLRVAGDLNEPVGEDFPPKR